MVQKLAQGKTQLKDVKKEKIPSFRETYLEAVHLVESLHRCLLDVIKDEFERYGERDVNSIQALLIYNIGDNEFSASELRARRHYLGSNVSYNLKKLVQMGYIDHQRSETDRRSVRVKLTTKGYEVRKKIDRLYERHLVSISKVGSLDYDNLRQMNNAMRLLERFWTDQIRYRL